MKKWFKILGLLASLLFATPVAATPVITTTSGTIQTGQTLTVTGTGFGSKPVAAPMKYDDFEAGTLNSDIANGWYVQSAANCSHSGLNPIYSNTVLRTNSTRSAKARFDESLDPACANGAGAEDGAYYSSNFGLTLVPTPGFSNGLYVNAWLYYANASPESRNVKFLRVHSRSTDPGGCSSAWCPNLYVNVYCGNNGDGMRVGQDASSGGSAAVYGHYDNCSVPCTAPWHGASWWSGGGSTYNTRTTMGGGTWRHLSLYLKENTVGLSNGIVKLTTDQVLDPDKSNFLNRTSNTFWDTVVFGNFVGHGTIDGICTVTSTHDTDIYWDNVYVDSTRAHVEIGDAPTYSGCTHTEIQIPSAWSSTSITLRENLGSFSSPSNLYLYVMDDQGVINPTGFLMSSTVSSTTSYFTPEAGSTLSPIVGQAAIAYAVTCPNNDLLANNARIKIVLKTSGGSPIVGVPAASIYALINGGPAGQGFSGVGDDSLMASSTWQPLAGCPNVRQIIADAATDATGTTYITWQGTTVGQPGVATRDRNRKWGMWAGDIPIIAQSVTLQGRILAASANGTYTAHIKNVDIATSLAVNAGEQVSALDLNPIQAAILAHTYVYRYDFNNDGLLDSNDYAIAKAHSRHRCNYPNAN